MHDYNNRTSTSGEDLTPLSKSSDVHFVCWISSGIVVNDKHGGRGHIVHSGMYSTATQRLPGHGFVTETVVTSDHLGQYKDLGIGLKVAEPR